MPKTIRSKILTLIVCLMVTTSIVFIIITTKNLQTEISTQSHRLAKETLASTIRIIDSEYNDLLSDEIDDIRDHRGLMEDVGRTILSMVGLYYELQKKGFLTEQLAKELCLDRLNECRYHKNNYFFVYDFDLNGLSHPNSEMVGKKWSGFENLKKRDALNQILKVIKSEEKSFTVFMWPRLEDMQLVKQIGYFFYFPQWEWIIGTAHEMSHIQKISLAKEEKTRSELKSILEQTNLNAIGGILIFDSHGKVVIHTSNIKNIDLYLTGTTLREPIQGHLKKATDNNIEKPVQYPYNDKIQIAYVNYYKYMNWYIAAFIDMNEIKKPISAVIVKLSATLVVVSLAGIFIAVFISGRIAFSISRLAQYARKLPSYNFKLGANPELGSIHFNSSNKEIKELTNAFAFMESSLGKNIQDMEKHQNTLEELINERTKELTGANKDLVREIHERKQAEEVAIILSKSLDKKVKKRTNELRRLNEHILYVEEKERKAFAADLHDSVAQTLALSISKIKNIQALSGPIDLKIIAQIQGYLEQSIKEIRAVERHFILTSFF
jgi:phosphoserine phosphatase RsbU/P